MERITSNQCFGGIQATYKHASDVCGTDMQFAIYLPPQATQSKSTLDQKTTKIPVLWYLSGLTCTEENATVKAGAQQYAAQHGIALVMPDTSPRGANIEGEDQDYDLGTGAGFYLNATQKPWSTHYQMQTYITEELQKLVIKHFPIDANKQGITGHSMGGHGALTLGLKHPEIYQSISAFSPICAPTQCDWGKKAFENYLGNNQQDWQQYDANELILAGHKSAEILIDQGDQDDFLENQLKPEIFANSCKAMEQPLSLRMQQGYDHSYFFIASFIEDHIAFHAKQLRI